MISETNEDSLRKLCERQAEKAEALTASNETQCQALIDADKRIKELKERLARAERVVKKVRDINCGLDQATSAGKLEYLIGLATDTLKTYDEGARRTDGH